MAPSFPGAAHVLPSPQGCVVTNEGALWPTKCSSGQPRATSSSWLQSKDGAVLCETGFAVTCTRITVNYCVLLCSMEYDCDCVIGRFRLHG